MTTNPLTCAVFQDRLMAYLEHDTDDLTRSAMEQHAADCGECGPLLADLRKLRVDASALAPLVPSHDLWSGIASRIEAPVVPIGVREGGRQVSPVVRRITRFALIAAGLVLAAELGYLTAARRTGTTPTTPAVARTSADTPLVVAVTPPPAPESAAESRPAVPSAPSRTQRPAAGGTTRATPVAAAPGTPARFAAGTANEPPAVQRAVANLSADYDREIARLRTLVDARRNQLDPVTVAIIEKNLMVIDTAIAECKKAIARDPASRFLIESLNQSLQSKVELMRIAALLPSRS